MLEQRTCTVCVAAAHLGKLVHHASAAAACCAKHNPWLACNHARKARLQLTLHGRSRCLDVI